MLKTNIGNVVSDADALVKAAADGRLSVRADAARHQGDYRRIVDGLNNTLDAVVGPAEHGRDAYRPDLQGRASRAKSPTATMATTIPSRTA